MDIRCATIEEIPLYHKEKMFVDNGAEITCVKAIVNSNTNEPASIVSNRYVLVQPKELIQRFAEATKTKLITTMIREGNLRGQFVSHFETDSDVEMTLLNSIDSSMSVMVVFNKVVEGKRFYGKPFLKRMHMGDKTNDVIDLSIDDLEGERERFKALWEGLESEITDSITYKQGVIDEVIGNPLPSKRQERLQGFLDDIDNSRTYLDIYRAIQNYVYSSNGKKKSEVKETMKVIRLFERCIADVVLRKIEMG